MIDLITYIVAIMILIVSFTLPFAVIAIIILVIVKSLKRVKNNTKNHYIPPSNMNYQQTQYKQIQNNQNAHSAVPNRAYNYKPQTNYVPHVNNKYIPSGNINKNYSNNQNFPYQAVSLLTEREYHFFKILKVIAERNNLNVLMKIRLADLVNVRDSVPKSEFYKHFNKVSSKHIDFALVDEIRVVVLIELDDSTHSQKKRIERDNFVDETVTKCGYRIIHTYGNTKQIEDAIMQYRKSAINVIA